jgi:arginyl-tRNA synthetase
MKLELIVSQAVVQAVQSLYNVEVSLDSVQLQKTKKEFEGDLTVVIFPFVKAARKSPEDTAREIGQFLHDNQALIANFNVIKGFLNLDYYSG